jgi:hypothetical protein
MEDRRMQAIRIPKLTVRRMMILVAATAILLAATAHGGNDPGLYFSGGGWRAGAWRDGTTFSLGPDGPYGFTYEAGVARREGMGRVGLLGSYRTGSVYLLAGRAVSLLW